MHGSVRTPAAARPCCFLGTAGGQEEKRGEAPRRTVHCKLYRNTDRGGGTHSLWVVRELSFKRDACLRSGCTWWVVWILPCLWHSYLEWRKSGYRYILYTRYAVVCSHRYTFNIFIRILFSVYNTTIPLLLNQKLSWTPWTPEQPADVNQRFTNLE